MDASGIYAGPALYVPMALQALVLTNASMNAAWSWAPPNYSFLKLFQPVEMAPFTQQAPRIPGMDQFRGVILHWALPDGLTHGRAGESGAVHYPDIPNRWLVVRKSMQAARPHAWSYQSWIIASDYTPGSSPFVDGGGSAIAIGKCWPIADWPGEAAVRAHAVAQPLTAMGAGDATYAAYVPNVPSALAFADAMEGVLEGPVSYTVFGWYAEPARDPMQGASLFGPAGWQTEAEWLDLMAQRGWTVGGPADVARARQAAEAWAKRHHEPADPSRPRDVLPSRTLCHGLLHDVAWLGRNGPHVSGVPTNLPASAGYVRPQIAIANSTDDALAALIVTAAAQRGFDKEKLAELQAIISAFQCDALQLLDQDDAQAQLALRLRANWFAARPGGTRFAVVGPETEQQPGEKPVPPLTPAQSALCTRLNTAQAALDATEMALQAEQKALFEAWWKGQHLARMLPPPPDQQKWADLIEAATRAAMAAIQAGQIRWLVLRQRRDAAFIELHGILDTLRLVSRPAQSFVEPNEPILLVTGAHRAFLHGADDRFDADGTLFCRVSGQTIVALDVAVGGTPVSVAATQLGLPDAAWPEVPLEAADLVAEYAMLDTSYAPLIATLASPADPWAILGQIRAEQTLIWNGAVHPVLHRRTLEDRTGLRTMFDLGALPSKLGVVAWTPPWSPLFLDWKLRFIPGSPAPLPALAPWAFPGAAGAGAPGDDFAYRWDGTVPPPEGDGFTAAGRTLLTPQGSETFAARLEKMIALYADQPDVERDLWALQTALDYVLNADVLSQAASGFNAAILQTQQQVFVTPQPGDPVWPWLNPALAPAFAATASPLPDSARLAFNPIRAGHFSVQELWVVDAFGQVFDVLGAMDISPQNLAPILSPDLVTKDSDRLVEFKPRMTQPARLRFDLLDAADDDHAVGIDTGANPVCGWLIPNRLNRSLLVYDAQGVPCGELFVARDAARWFPSPRHHKPPQGGPPAIDIANRHLAAMIRQIVAAAGSKSALLALLALIDELAFTIGASSWGDQALPVLVGEPVALVRARLGLELAGGPACSQRWDDTGRDVTDGFGAVPVTVQLGSSELTDDGLVGAYLNDDYRQIAGAHRLAVPDPYVTRMHPAVTGTGPATLLTLLMAPRAKVHVLSGMFPAAVQTLPAECTTQGLERLELQFRTGPVLGDPAGVAVPLPALRAGTWSWLQYHGTAAPARAAAVAPADAAALLPNLPPIAREGWLSLVPGEANTLLTYAVAPTTVPVTTDPVTPAAVVLEISAYNGSGAAAAVEGITFIVPTGDGEDALTAQPALILPRLRADSGFRAETDGRGRITLRALQAGQSIAAGATLSVALAGVQINRAPGTALIAIEESSDATRATSVPIIKVRTLNAAAPMRARAIDGSFRQL